MRRFALALTTLVVGLAAPAAALAAPTVTTSTPTYSETQSATMVQVDKVLTKLNALEDKLNALTVKLDATTAKLDTMALQSKNIYDTVHYTKGYLQGGVSNLQEQLRRTCGVAEETRDLAAYAAIDSWIYAHVFSCP